VNRCPVHQVELAGHDVRPGHCKRILLSRLLRLAAAILQPSDDCISAEWKMLQVVSELRRLGTLQQCHLHLFQLGIIELTLFRQLRTVNFLHIFQIEIVNIEF